MKAYRFELKVSKNGTIQLPVTPGLSDQEVEVIILPRKETISKKNSARDFIDKWKGFLKSDNPDDLKYSYLSEKYK